MGDYLKIETISSMWYVSEGFIAVDTNGPGEEWDKAIKHNNGASQMILAGPFKSKNDAEAVLPTLTKYHQPFVWQAI